MRMKSDSVADLVFHSIPMSLDVAHLLRWPYLLMLRRKGFIHFISGIRDIQESLLLDASRNFLVNCFTSMDG